MGSRTIFGGGPGVGPGGGAGGQDVRTFRARTTLGLTVVSSPCVVGPLVYALAPGLPEGEFNFPTTDLWVYDTVADSWEQLGSLGTQLNPPPDHYMQSGALIANGSTELILVGTDTADPRTLTYDIGGDSWSETRAPMPASLEYFGPAVLDGKLYTFGGEEVPGGGFTDAIYVYDIAGDSWSTSAVTLPAPYGYTATCVSGGLIYVFMGFDETGSHRLLDVYDPDADDWDGVGLQPNPPNAIDLPGAVSIVDGEILLLGGQPAFATKTRVAWTFDTLTGAYSMLGNLPFAGECWAVDVGGIAYALAFNGDVAVLGEFPLETMGDIPAPLMLASQDGPAVTGTSTNGEGVQGVGYGDRAGVRGVGAVVGVEGYGSVGVRGEGHGSTGVRGKGFGDYTAGVYGESDGSPNSLGVLAQTLGVENAEAPASVGAVTKLVPIFDGNGDEMGVIEVKARA